MRYFGLHSEQRLSAVSNALVPRMREKVEKLGPR